MFCVYVNEWVIELERERVIWRLVSGGAEYDDDNSNPAEDCDDEDQFDSAGQCIPVVIYSLIHHLPKFQIGKTTEIHIHK